MEVAAVADMAKSTTGRTAVTAAALKKETVLALSAVERMWSMVDAVHAAGNILNEIPEGAFSARQYATRYGLTEHRSRHRLESMVQAGQLRIMKARAIDRLGRIVVQNAYSVISAESKQASG